MATRISSGDVEAVLAAVNSIRPEAMAAFRGRIKHLQRQGFPAGSNTGKGKPAEQTLDTLLQLVFAFELSQAGLPPAMVIDIINGNWHFMREACVLALLDDEDIATQTSPWPDGDLFFVISPIALDQLMVDPAVRGGWPDNVEVLHRSQLLERISATDAHLFSPWRLLVIHVRFLVSVARSELMRVRPDLHWQMLWTRLWKDSQASGEGFDVKFRDLEAWLDVQH